MKQWIPFGRDGASDSKRLWASVAIVLVIVGLAGVGIVTADSAITEGLFVSGDDSSNNELQSMSPNEKYYAHTGGSGSSKTIYFRNATTNNIVWSTGGLPGQVSEVRSYPNNPNLFIAAGMEPSIGIFDVANETRVAYQSLGQGSTVSTDGVDVSPGGDYVALQGGMDASIRFYDGDDLSSLGQATGGYISSDYELQDHRGRVKAGTEYTYYVNTRGNISVYAADNQSYIRELDVGGNADTLGIYHDTVATASNGRIYTIKDGQITRSISDPAGALSAVPVLNGNGIAVYTGNSIEVLDATDGTIVNSTSAGSNFGPAPMDVDASGELVGYAAYSSGGVYDVSGVELALSDNDTATIDGLVNDAATDAPIANATVKATYDGSVVATDTTDSNGNYDLGGLTQGYDYTITANATGYDASSTTYENLQRNLTIDFGLSGSTVTAYGYITDDETGEYVDNATVTIGTQSVQTGSIAGTPDGYYAIDLKLGDYDMTVEADGYQTYTETLSVDGETRKDVALASTTNPIYGTITYAETGGGIGGAVVEVVSTTTGETINSTRTNDVGEYTLPNLSDGTYNVFATYSGTTKAYTLTLNGSGEQVDFAFSKDEYMLTGTVRDARETQQTLADVSVTVFADDSQTVVETLTTDSNGEFNTTLAPGDYRVLFELADYRSVRRNITIADQPQSLDVEMIQLADALDLNTNPYLNHDTEQPFSVTLAYPDGSVDEVTADATVTSANTTLISVNPTEQILIATADTNLSGTVEITATYTDKFGNQYTDSYNVTVAPLELSHFEKLPPVQRFAAWMEDSNSLTIIIATSAGAAVSLAATSFAGIAAVVLVMIAGWFGGFVTTGLMLVAILTGTMIGLNLANAVDIEMRGGK